MRLRNLLGPVVVAAVLALTPDAASAADTYAAWNGYTPTALRGANEIVTGTTYAAEADDADGDGSVDRVRIVIQPQSGSPRELTFASTGTGRPLEPGIYREASSDPFPGQPLMRFNSFDICNGAGAGVFEVLYAKFDTSSGRPLVVSFWARYELFCNLESYPFFGEVAYEVPDLPRVDLVRAGANGRSLSIYGELVETATSALVDGTPAKLKADPAGGLRVKAKGLADGRHELRLGGPDGYVSPPFAFTIGDDPPFAKNSFKVTSDPHDIIGDGGTYTFKNPPMALRNFLDRAGHPVLIALGTATFEKDFGVEVTSEKTGAPLAVGSYPDAMRYPFEEDGHPGIEIGSTGRPGCNTIAGSFVITSYGVDGRLLDRVRWIALTFETHCDGNPAGLRGSARYVAPESVAVIGARYSAADRTLRVRARGLTADSELWIDGQRLGPTRVEGDTLVLGNVSFTPGRHLVGVFRNDVLSYSWSQPWFFTAP